MVRVGFAVSLCDSVVAIQDAFASPVWESDACAQAETLEQKYAPTMSSMSWLKRAARDGRAWLAPHWRPTHADRKCPSHSEIFPVSTLIILPLPTFGVQRDAWKGAGDTSSGHLLRTAATRLYKTGETYADCTPRTLKPSDDRFESVRTAAAEFFRVAEG
jgi:hypothetical protein